MEEQQLKKLHYHRGGMGAEYYLAELNMDDEARKSYIEKTDELRWATAYDELDKLETRLLKGTKERAQNIIKTSKNKLDIGVAYGILGKHEKVIEILKKYMKTNPTEIDVLYNIGVAYFNLGEYQNALRYFATIISLDDQEKITGIYGGWGRGDFDRGSVFNRIASAYEKLGEHNKAEACSIYADILISSLFVKLEQMSPSEKKAYQELLDIIFKELSSLTLPF